MKVIVTGGAGFVGSHVCVALADAGHVPIIFDNFSNAKRDVPERIARITGSTVHVIEGDIRSRDQVEEALGDTGAASVVHCAAFKAVGESVAEPLKYYANNVAGTVTLLEAMEARGVRSLVFSSSATVYGDPDQVPVTEESSANRATNPYGWTKVMMEQVINDVHASDDRWSISLLRYFNPVGAHHSGYIGEDPNGIPTNLMPYIAQVAAGKLDRLSVFGGDYPTPDGTGIRDYIHVEDLAIGHVAALEAMTPGSRLLYNLGTGKGVSVLELVRAFETATGVEVPYDVVARRPGDVAETWAAVGKAQEDLGWQATRTIEDMCADMWRWQRSDFVG